MNRLLGSLTPRGRWLAALGLALIVVAFGLGDRDLARLAVLVLLLPLLAGWAVARSRTTLHSQRWLTSARVAAGESVTVRIQLSNGSRVPTGVLLAEDVLPPTLGARARFVVDRLGAQAGVEVHYPLRCERRGRYRLGPVAVRLRDPFGLAELGKSFADVDELVVTPAVHPLPLVRLGGEWAGLGESTRRSVATAGEDDASVREYRLGDDLRRVHWRSTARRGELMVRREEQPWESRAVLLLDTRATAHTGEGPTSSLEWAVSAVASVGVHLDREGFALRLVFDTGTSVEAAATAGPFTDAMLDTLATCAVSRSGSLRPGLATIRQGGGEGLLVAVVADPDLDAVEAMIRARGSGVTAVALIVDAGSWSGRGGDTATVHRAARLLTIAGWRVAIARHGSDVAALWHEVDAGRRPDSLGAVPPDPALEAVR